MKVLAAIVLVVGIVLAAIYLQLLKIVRAQREAAEREARRARDTQRETRRWAAMDAAKLRDEEEARHRGELPMRGDH